MRGWMVWGALLVTACATAPKTQRWASVEHAFEIHRPSGDGWHFASGHVGPAGIEIPVVVRHLATGAQVVVQIAPEVAPALEFAERLAFGLTERHGFATTAPQRRGERSAEFLFTADGVFGRVGIVREEGRLFVLLGTWPSDAPEEVAKDVEVIMRSLRALPGGEGRDKIFAAELEAQSE